MEQAEARVNLDDQPLTDCNPALRVQLNDPYEMPALHTMPRAIREAAANTKADATAPGQARLYGFELEATIYAPIAVSCLTAFDAAYGGDPAEQAIAAYEAVTVPSLPEGAFGYCLHRKLEAMR